MDQCVTRNASSPITPKPIDTSTKNVKDQMDNTSASTPMSNAAPNCSRLTLAKHKSNPGMPIAQPSHTVSRATRTARCGRKRNIVVTTDKQATLYYQFDEGRVRMLIGSEKVIPVLRPMLRIATGVLLSLSYVQAYVNNEDNEWLSVDYGQCVNRDDECDRAIYVWSVFGLLWIMLLVELFEAYKVQRTFKILVFLVVAFCVMPPPFTSIEEKLVLKGLGDPFKCIATIILCRRWTEKSTHEPKQRNVIWTETWLGMMIVSHDRLFYGIVPGIVWFFVSVESLTQVTKLKTTTPIVALVISVVRFVLYKPDTTCLLISATPTEAIFLSCVTVLSGVSDAFSLAVLRFCPLGTSKQSSAKAKAILGRFPPNPFKRL